LRKIGANKTIGSFTEGTPNANFMNDRFAEARDDLLRSHPWNFAVQRAILAQSSVTPTSGFDYQYPLPSGWLRTLGVWDNDAEAGALPYREENSSTDGNVIVTDASDVYLKYVAQITDANIMTADFRECLACKLAVDAAIGIANSNTMRELMMVDLDSKMMQAKSTDSLGDRPGKLARGTWVSRRFRDPMSGWS
jgi:hypothetical protein